jgi:hypothetical protein
VEPDIRYTLYRKQVGDFEELTITQSKPPLVLVPPKHEKVRKYNSFFLKKTLYRIREGVVLDVQKEHPIFIVTTNNFKPYQEERVEVNLKSIISFLWYRPQKRQKLRVRDSVLQKTVLEHQNTVDFLKECGSKIYKPTTLKSEILLFLNLIRTSKRARNRGTQDFFKKLKLKEQHVQQTA